jgi:hypothetical protein
MVVDEKTLRTLRSMNPHVIGVGFYNPELERLWIAREDEMKARWRRIGIFDEPAPKMDGVQLPRRRGW